MDKCCPAEVRLLDGCEVQLGISPWALGSSKVVVVVRLMAGVVLNHRTAVGPSTAILCSISSLLSHRLVPGEMQNRLASSCLLLK